MLRANAPRSGRGACFCSAGKALHCSSGSQPSPRRGYGGRHRLRTGRLTLLGVPMWQRGLVVATQAVLLTATGVALAWVAATLAAAAIGEGELARHALLASSGVLAMALLALASTVAVVCALVANADEPGRFGALDVIAAGLALAVAAALVRGAADTEEVLRGGGSGALLIALPVAVVAIVGIVAARALPRLVLLVARALPDRRLTARLALLSIARRPGAGATAVAFLVVSIGLAVFAGTYRATLEQGRRDQAAFALGADLVLREDLSRLVPVREVATPERLQRLGPRVAAAPVLRATGNVAGLSDVTGVAVLGVEPAAAPNPSRFRSRTAEPRRRCRARRSAARRHAAAARALVDTGRERRGRASPPGRQLRASPAR